MRKTFILAAVAAILFSGFAMAQNPVWMLDPTGAWVPADPVCDASMEHSGNWSPQPSPGLLAVPCGPIYWTFCCLPCVDERPDGSPLVITTTAIVMQWMQATFSGKDVLWIVQHPGTYAADTMFFDIMSNGDIGVFTTGAGNLVNVDPGAPGDQEIELFWGEGVGQIPSCWVPAADLDQFFEIIPIREEPDHQIVFHLWQKIVVEKCNTCGIYTNQFTITFCPTCDFLL